MEVIKAFYKNGKKQIQNAERLAEELQKYLCLYEKGNKGFKEIDRKANAWRAVEQFLIVF